MGLISDYLVSGKHGSTTLEALVKAAYIPTGISFTDSEQAKFALRVAKLSDPKARELALEILEEAIILKSLLCHAAENVERITAAVEILAKRESEAKT